MEQNSFINSALELPYPQGSHIYFLLRDGAVVYVGKSDSLLARIGTHSREKLFDCVKYFPVESTLQAEIEMALIKAFRPEYNAQRVSKLTEREKSILKDFNLTDEILGAIVRSQPKVKQYHWGHVAFFSEDGKLEAGYYDDDASREEDQHDDGCPYIEAKDILGEVDDALDELLIEKCRCQEFAVVRFGFHHYQLVHLHKLYDIDADDLSVLRERFEKKFTEEFQSLREAN